MNKGVYYDEEVIQALYDVQNPTCIALITGGGKTQSIIEFIKRNQDKRHLIIVGSKEEQSKLKSELAGIFDFWNSDRGENLNKILESEICCISITKEMFKILLTQDDAHKLSDFEYIYYDEFASLNPCLVNDLTSDLSEIQTYTSKIFSKVDINIMNNIESLYKDIKERIIELVFCDEKPLFNRVLKLDCDENYINKAKSILSVIKISKEIGKKSKMNIKINNSILFMLHSIINNKLYTTSYQFNEKVIHHLLGVNDKIKDFIQNTNSKFIVMDATADIVKDVYSYLGIEVVDDFQKNIDKTYEHVNMNFYEFKDAETKMVRGGDSDTLDKMSQIIKDRSIISFVPKKIKDVFKENYGYEIEKVFHFFSGDDIGSNDFKNEKELNIYALQTYPKTMRILYNHIIKGISLEKANFSRNDFAEFELLSSHLVQTINRSKSRIYDCEEEININLIAVPKYVVLKASSFMKGSNLVYKTNLDAPSYNLKDRVLSCLNDHIKSYEYKEVIELDTFLIERRFFKTITTMMKFINENIKDLNKMSIKLGFELKIKESTRPYLQKFDIDYILTDSEFLAFDTTRNKFLSNFVNFKNSDMEDIKISNFKTKYNIKNTYFTNNYTKFEDIIREYGVFRVGNSFISMKEYKKTDKEENIN